MRAVQEPFAFYLRDKIKQASTALVLLLIATGFYFMLYLVDQAAIVLLHRSTEGWGTGFFWAGIAFAIAAALTLLRIICLRIYLQRRIYRWSIQATLIDYLVLCVEPHDTASAAEADPELSAEPIKRED